MLFSSLLYPLTLLVCTASAILTTGASGSVGTRYEIRQLANNYPQQYTLFLLAMQQFKAMPQSTQNSYYQISGIHGVPRVSFDGVNQCSSCTNADGYCTHSSILFLAWHRPYLALFEQRLVNIAKSIASQYPTSTRASYQAAASNLRLPYWDWAARPPNGGNALSNQMSQPTVQVTTPTGVKTINNPLYQHNFVTPKNLFYPPFTTWPNTLRYPTSNAAGATSNQAKAVAAFNNIRASLQDRLYQLFSTCTTYSEVGLDSQSSARCSTSLEQLHNTIHTTAGGPATTNPNVSGGHMTYLSTSAFDPIFWLHHANVDRLFAMWQAIYPDSYGATGANGMVSWAIPAGATVNANTPLYPFRKTTSAFWTTNDVRSTKTFRYTYPEFVDSDGSAGAIRSYVNALYGPSATATAGSSKRTAAPEPALTDILDSTPLKAANGSLFQYVANINTPRFALNGSYNIYLFNGEPTASDPADFVLDSNLIGPMGVLAMDMDGENLMTAGSIPLTRTLTDAVSAGQLPNLTPLSVVPYLAKNLQWIIVGPAGDVVDQSSLPGFDLTVYSSTATPVTGDLLPMWSQFIPLDDVTEERADGATTSSATSSTTTSKAKASSTTNSGTSTTRRATSTGTRTTASPSTTGSSVRRRQPMHV